MERFSKKREAILSCLRGTDSHPTAEWVFQRLKLEYPDLSLGTVYRNLCQLKEAGLVCSVGVHAGEEHFDGNVVPHSHVICDSCGKVVDLSDPVMLRELLNDAEKATGFSLTAMRLTGLCPECLAGRNGHD